MNKIISILLSLMICSGCAAADQKFQKTENPPALPEAVSTDAASVQEKSLQEMDKTVLEEEKTATADKQLPFSERIICIDPGHCVTPEIGKGGRELVSPLSNETKLKFGGGTTGKNLTEEKLNLMVGLKLRERLNALGATTIMTREVSEITLSNIERCEIANQSGADVCIRIHADGVDDTSVKGISVLIPDGELLGTPEIVEESARLGELMVNAVASETGSKNRGTVKRSDLTGFNFSKIPTVLIEMGFMTNPEEDALLETETYQDKIVNGIVNSLADWYQVSLQS